MACVVPPPTRRLARALPCAVSLLALLATSCAIPPRSGQAGRDAGADGRDDDDGTWGDGDSDFSGDGDDYWSDGNGDGDAPAGGGGTDFGAILCGLIGGCDGGVMGPAPYDGGTASSGDDSIVPGREPDPNTPPECPKHAPDNPVGSCIGLPIYVTCSYTTYHCICDWYHWLCI